MSHTQRNAACAKAIFGLHIDWFYNTNTFETRQEKGAYDQNLQVSVHPMMIHTKNSTWSVGATSDCTDHKAPDVWIGLEKVLPIIISEKK